MYLEKDLKDNGIITTYTNDNREISGYARNPINVIKKNIATNLLYQFNLYKQLLSLTSFKNKYAKSPRVFQRVSLSISLIIEREIKKNHDLCKQQPTGFNLRKWIFPHGKLGNILSCANEELLASFIIPTKDKILERYNPIPILEKIEACCKLTSTNNPRPITYGNRIFLKKAKTLHPDAIARKGVKIGRLVSTPQEKRQAIIQKFSLLCFAARHGLDQEINAMLAMGANINQIEHNQQTPLHHAVYYQQITVVKKLLKHQELDLMQVDKAGRNALFYAVEVNNLACLKLIISHYQGPPSKLFYCGDKPYPILQHALSVVQERSKKHGLIDYLLKSQFKISYGTIYAPLSSIMSFGINTE